MVDFELISNKERLHNICQELSNLTELAVDLECENNLHHYGAYITLIQLSSRQKNWIIDILAFQKEGLASLFEIFKQPTIQKIFHDVSFDFRILYHQFGCQPKNIFDTQIAAFLLGKEQVGLGSLLAEAFSIHKESKFQRVDWTRRPLSSAMLNYAAGDTAHLLKLKDYLTQELIKKERLNWADQEFKQLEQVDFSYNEQTYLDVSGVRSMQPNQRTIFHFLFDERNKLAKELNAPPFMIMGNKVMLSLALDPLTNLTAWQNLRGVHPIIRKNAQIYYEQVKVLMQGPGEILERVPRPKLTTNQAEKIKQLTELRNLVGQALGIRSHLIVNQEQMIDLVVSQSLNSLREWQKAVLLSDPKIKQLLETFIREKDQLFIEVKNTVT